MTPLMRIMYRHSNMDKPGVGNIDIITNRITGRIRAVLVWPDDGNPPIHIENGIRRIIDAAAVCVNAAMLRSYAEHNH